MVKVLSQNYNFKNLKQPPGQWVPDICASLVVEPGMACDATDLLIYSSQDDVVVSEASSTCCLCHNYKPCMMSRNWSRRCVHQYYVELHGQWSADRNQKHHHSTDTDTSRANTSCDGWIWRFSWSGNTHVWLLHWAHLQPVALSVWSSLGRFLKHEPGPGPWVWWHVAS